MLLEVSDLRIAFNTKGESNEVVRGIDFAVDAGGQTVAILGESGSGKSVTCMALTRLLPEPPLCTIRGQVLFEGEDVLQMRGRALRSLRGEGIAYIFQEPSSSLNPVFTVGYQIAEAVRLGAFEVGAEIDWSNTDYTRERYPDDPRWYIPGHARISAVILQADAVLLWTL